LKCGVTYFFRELVSPVFIALPLVGAGVFLAFLTGNWPPLLSITSTTAILLAFYGCGVWFLSPRLAKELMAGIRLFPAR